MRIGELAALAGVTTRTVRHYHRIGLLPEPARRANGYRVYTLRDAVELARVRRLTELGLSLDEVRDALADDIGKELHEILAELDADLARQEAAIRQRRARLAELLRYAEGGGLTAEGPVSPELAAVFADMSRTSARLGVPEPASAAKERELLALLDTTADDAHRGWLDALLHALSADPEAMTRAYDIYARLDELADAEATDPRVEELARDVLAALPDEALALMAAGPDEAGTRAGEDGDEGREAFAEMFFADFPPAQAEVLRRAMVLFGERTSGAGEAGGAGRAERRRGERAS
ncbi:MerR family transcriptional regulator [Streptomyces sp. CMB-StM0423]|uniref:MerR family transcriptional regulator n=1 Tax=Streptomyces sp. CMB-StM0423 TaxID=2059884 RepID=UPI000C6FF080|nr:MerR family transcriptional regulator [Streptomyces sp. CMB-StM0423]AUH43309.1 MerR family transcriptional regulator [Streptomyces sp. CMB-StM0423]